MTTFLSLLRRLGGVGALALTLLLSVAGFCSAANLVVQNTNSSGAGSLRQAIFDAGVGDTITFDPSVTGTIYLDDGQLPISQDVTITGPGASVLAIDGENSDRVFDITSGTVVISGLTLQNGSSGGNGGAVDNFGTLTITNCVISGSNAYLGGGLFNENSGILTLTDDTISNNSTNSDAGGLFSDTGSVATMTNCTFSSNSANTGGAIFSGAALTVTNCTFSSNTASGSNAGGIYNVGTTSITASLFAGSNGGDIVNAGGTVTSGGSNLLSDGDGNGFANGVSHDQTGVSNALIGSLANHGGPTPTCAVLDGSPAAGADFALLTATDQRGFARTAAQHTIGAFEAGVVPTLTSITVTAATASVAPGRTDQFTATAAYSDNTTGDVTSTATWSSDTPAAGTIDAAGLATGVADGTTHVTAALSSVTSNPIVLTVHTPTTLVVTNTLDDGSLGCLRSVFSALGAGDTVTFAPNVTGTISLTGGDLLISQDVTIIGPGAGVLAIDGGGMTTLFIIVGGTDAISGLTLENGSGGNGGAIENAVGTLTVSDCTITGSHAVLGGGVSNDNQGVLTLIGDTLSNNVASLSGGGLSTLSNRGGVSVTNCTFSGNTAHYGGSLINTEPLAITNCTFSGNTATSGNAGGIYNSGMYGSGGLATITASLFAGSNGGDIVNAGGTVTSGGSNLLSDGDGNGFANGVNHDQTGVSAATANLDTLADNGGPTPTCATLPGSPAIGGDFALATNTDQRGFARTATQHTIGAYEANASPSLVEYAHLLWTHTNGKASVWNVNTDGTFTYHLYGPYAGWTATALSAGPDGHLRLLWTHTSGMVSLWNLGDAQPDQTYHLYGPYAGWTASGLIVGSDNAPHILWTHTNGKASVWNVNTDGTFTYHLYGPYAGWRATSLGVGTDSNVQILWTHTSGLASLWDLGDAQPDQTYHLYGPFNGWSAVSVATGP